jgi:CRISPR/Cas system-associated endonuclease Cas1
LFGPNAALRVRRGALTIEHGEDASRIKHKLDIDDPPPCAILFDGRGEFLTGDAIRFCTQRGIVLAMPDGPGRIVTIAHSALEATEGETLRDVGPAIIRAQCSADPVRIAREIVGTKITADKGALGPRVTPAMPQTIARCEAALMSTRSVADIVLIEAKAASVYWRSWRDLGLIERKGGNLPASWRRFSQRTKGPEFLGNKHAAHPISAMINYCVVVEAGRLARALTGLGLVLQVGFLHSDKHGRNSLVWDCIEPLRARINANVFKFIACSEFARADFPASGIKTHRIARPIIAELLKRCLLPDGDILDAATWLRDLVMAHGIAATPSRKPGRSPSSADLPPLSRGRLQTNPPTIAFPTERLKGPSVLRHDSGLSAAPEAPQNTVRDSGHDGPKPFNHQHNRGPQPNLNR